MQAILQCTQSRTLRSASASASCLAACTCAATMASRCCAACSRAERAASCTRASTELPACGTPGRCIVLPSYRYCNRTLITVERGTPLGYAHPKAFTRTKA